MKAIRPIRIEGDLAYVPLSKDGEAVIDAADAERVGQHNWTKLRSCNVFYANANIISEGKRVSIGLHRFLMQPSGGLHVDHINSDGLDCRRANLRLATPTENQRNARRKISNSSGHKGVSWRADRQKWQVHIRVDGRRLSLGHYSALDQAAAAYARAAQEHHGEFARLG